MMCECNNTGGGGSGREKNNYYTMSAEAFWSFIEFLYTISRELKALEVFKKNLNVVLKHLYSGYLINKFKFKG